MVCKHHWMLGRTTPEGTPARCKLCGEEYTFCTQGPLDKATREEIHSRSVLPSRMDKATMPFNPSGHSPRKGWDKWRGQRVGGTRL